MIANVHSISEYFYLSDFQIILVTIHICYE